MQEIKSIIAMLGEQLKKRAGGNVVVANPISDGERHVLPLCELSIAFGGGGGSGESLDDKGQQTGQGKGRGGGVGGSAKATPVAVIVADEHGISIKTLGK